MNKVILITSGLAATLLILLGTFVTAAGMRGANLHELPVIGSLFPEPEEASIDTEIEDATATVEEAIQNDRRSDEQVIDMSASPLKAFLLPTPWNAAELEALETELQTRLGAIREREKELDGRQAALEESQRHLEELQAEMERVRTGLIEERDDTDAMADEVEQEKAAAEARQVSGLKRMASLFADGDPEETAQMLVDTYSPKEAGIVLSGLSPERVATLMQGIRAANPKILGEVEESYRSHLSEE